eukprot:scaffold8855_cov125-Isochrysis_galbana.AAC.3
MAPEVTTDELAQQFSELAELSGDERRAALAEMPPERRQLLQEYNKKARDCPVSSWFTACAVVRSRLARHAPDPHHRPTVRSDRARHGRHQYDAQAAEAARRGARRAGAHRGGAGVAGVLPGDGAHRRRRRAGPPSGVGGGGRAARGRDGQQRLPRRARQDPPGCEEHPAAAALALVPSQAGPGGLQAGG